MNFIPLGTVHKEKQTTLTENDPATSRGHKSFRGYKMAGSIVQNNSRNWSLRCTHIQISFDLAEWIWSWLRLDKTPYTYTGDEECVKNKISYLEKDETIGLLIFLRLMRAIFPTLRVNRALSRNIWELLHDHPCIRIAKTNHRRYKNGSTKSLAYRRQELPHMQDDIRNGVLWVHFLYRYSASTASLNP